MEVDIGVFFSLTSKDTYNKLWPNLTTAPPLQKSVILLRTYTGRCCRLCFCRCQIQGTYFSPPPDHGCWQRPKFTWPRLVKAHQIRLESLTSSGDIRTYWIIIMLYFAITLALWTVLLLSYMLIHRPGQDSTTSPSTLCYAGKSRTGDRLTKSRRHTSTSGVLWLGCSNCTGTQKWWFCLYLWGLQAHRQPGR